MTKLMEWLFCLVLFFGLWTSLIMGVVDSSWLIEHRQIILMFPIILVFLFAVYAAAVVLYRTFTFNNCEEAAEELQRHIAEAQAELRIKGVLQSNPKSSELM